MVVALDKTLKYRLVRGVRGGGFRGIRVGQVITKTITRSIFDLEDQHFTW